MNHHHPWSTISVLAPLSVVLVCLGCGGADATLVQCPEEYFEQGLTVEPPEVATCELESICSAVVFEEEDTPQLVDATPLDCVLNAMNDASVADHTLRSSFAGGNFGSLTHLEVLADGRVLWRGSRFEHSSREASITPYELDSSYDFTSCNTAQSLPELSSCIENGLLGCVDWASAPELCG